MTSLSSCNDSLHTLDLKRPAAILWDMDGTLIDSEPIWQASEYEVVGMGGGRWTHDDAMRLVGSDLHSAARVLVAAGAPFTPETLMDYLVERVSNEIRKNVPWREGAEETLRWIKDAGIPCALVTMSHRPVAQAFLDVVPEGTFDVIVSGDVVERGKPDPLPYVRAAELLGVDPRECIAVEDSKTGITAALGSGARTIGIHSQMELPVLPGLSRVRSLEHITPTSIDVILRGGTVDFYS